MNIPEATDFFRQVTVRICGSLDIQKALFDTYRYLRHRVPVDEVSYTHFVPDMGAIQFVACADREGGRDLGLTPMPLPQTMVDWMKQDITRKDYYTLNRPEENPLSPLITGFRGIDRRSSILVVRLLMGDTFLGSFNLACNGTDRYTDDQARLVAAAKEPIAIALANHLQHREVLRIKELKEDDNRFLKSELRHRFSQTVIGADFGLKQVMTEIRHVAGTASPVLLLGETGTGKEVIAHVIHNLSPRHNGPFVTINCGAIPHGLVDSELFGHEKGAFTGAVASSKGRFERADGGTVFLDEIGELPLEAQVRLLRVLQEKEIERVGSTKPISVDIRIVAATHRDLDAMVTDGRFRQDLLFRLRVFPVTLPPLRDRKADIPALVQHFFQVKGRELGMKHPPEITKAFLDRLMAYPWPGNVRELENHIERTLILSRGGPLRDDGTTDLLPASTPPADDDAPAPILPLDEAMKRHIEKALAHCGGRIEGDAGVAALLRIQPNTLRARMKKLGIPFGRKSNRPT
jgi:transcriptional regulator with GAF, ATPase, and Fis domain